MSGLYSLLQIAVIIHSSVCMCIYTNNMSSCDLLSLLVKTQCEIKVIPGQVFKILPTPER